MSVLKHEHQQPLMPKQQALRFTQNMIKVIETRQKKVSQDMLDNTNKINTALTTLINLSFQFKTARTVELLKDLTTR